MRHFSRKEFACRCGCGFDTVDWQLADHLDDVREYFDAPVIILSGCRCAYHNANEGGALHSQHLLGRAADFYIRGIDPHVIAQYLDALYPSTLGIGNYDTFTHIDTRLRYARWS